MENPKSMGHRFGNTLKCDMCKVKIERHWDRPRPCKMVDNTKIKKPRLPDKRKKTKETHSWIVQARYKGSKVNDYTSLKHRFHSKSGATRYAEHVREVSHSDKNGMRIITRTRIRKAQEQPNSDYGYVGPITGWRLVTTEEQA